MFTFSSFNLFLIIQHQGIWKISTFYCFIRLGFFFRNPFRVYHQHATQTWFLCKEMYHNVCRYEFSTFQTDIHLHNWHIFVTNNNQSEYAFLFPFSIDQVRLLYGLSPLICIIVLCSKYVFRIFLCRPFMYWFEILYMNLPLCHLNKVQPWISLT